MGRWAFVIIDSPPPPKLDQVTPTPPCIQAILDDHKAIFQDPQTLPPQRCYDHYIPLIPGALPVHVRPYRYLPAVKTEIERQITDVLQSGIIQPSNSPFSSSVLLVGKRTGHSGSAWIFATSMPSPPRPNM